MASIPTHEQCAGLIGHPVAHSWSPMMQEAAFAAAGIAAHYELWDTTPDQLAARIDSLRMPDMLGANVTIPYKVAVMPLLDRVTSEAQTTGAVNTIVRQATMQGIHLIGHNTDVPALRRVLREADAWAGGKRLLILGSGGAARAAVAVALLEGAEPWIAVRNPHAAQERLAAFPAKWRDHIIDLADSSALQAALAETNVLVNATPVGTRDASAAPFPLAWLKQLRHQTFVFDMIYNPPLTALVRQALACDLRGSGGMPMLLYQGAEAFSLWTGQPAPLPQMQAALEQQGKL